MSGACPREPELTRLLDGELTENRAADVRAHAATCARCAGALRAERRLLSDLAAPARTAPSDAEVEAVMRRLGPAEAPATRTPRRAGRWILGGLAATAAAALVAVVRVPGPHDGARAFAPRGSEVEWTRKVGFELWALERAPRRLSTGDRLGPGVPLVGSFSNVDPAPAYLLAFALDARGEVHWLYPAFVDPRSDPPSLRLDASVVQRALSESVILDGVAPGGALRFVFVVTREPLRVSHIESTPAPERTPAALRARWPGARVDELVVHLESPPPAAP